MVFHIISLDWVQFFWNRLNWFSLDLISKSIQSEPYAPLELTDVIKALGLKLLKVQSLPASQIDQPSRIQREICRSFKFSRERTNSRHSHSWGQSNPQDYPVSTRPTSRGNEKGYVYMIESWYHALNLELHVYPTYPPQATKKF